MVSLLMVLVKVASTGAKTHVDARYEGVLYALEVCPSAIVAIKMQTSESKEGASERASERESKQ